MPSTHEALGCLILSTKEGNKSKREKSKGRKGKGEKKGYSKKREE